MCATRREKVPPRHVGLATIALQVAKVDSQLSHVRPHCRGHPETRHGVGHHGYAFVRHTHTHMFDARDLWALERF